MELNINILPAHNNNNNKHLLFQLRFLKTNLYELVQTER
jgi:hypothetical protein